MAEETKSSGGSDSLAVSSVATVTLPSVEEPVSVGSSVGVSVGSDSSSRIKIDATGIESKELPDAPHDTSSAVGVGLSSLSGDGTFVFQEVPSDPLPSFASSKDLSDLLKKWDLEQYRCVKKFRIGQKFDIGAKDAFLRDFFNDPAVRAAFQVTSSARAPASLSGTVRSVTSERLRTSVLKMDFFDRCQEEDIVLDSGYIRKTWEQTIDGVTVADLLRDMVINPDSDNLEVYSDEEREEFIFHLFRLIVTGGGMCQYEDSWDAYLEAVKMLYKDLLTVTKTESGKLVVSSLVFKITDVDCDSPLFPNDSPHSVCFVVVEPKRRTATVFYNAFMPFW